MRVLGIIVEYNPMHEGHRHHLQKAKEMTNCDVVIAVMSGNYVQRGEVALVDKFTRAKIAIENGVDLVVELPLVSTVQGADYFCHAAVSILNSLHVDDLVFGSESGDLTLFEDIAHAINDHRIGYNELVKKNMNEGLRYPDACNKALSTLLNKSITTPNDILALGYIKEIIKHHYPITPHCIQRTTDYLSQKENDFSSGYAIRKAIKKDAQKLNDLIGHEMIKETYHNELLFPYLKYKLLTSSKEELSQIHLVEEGIENLMLKNIQHVSSYQEFVDSLTSKRYTKTRIQRTLIHILLNNTKEEVQEALNISYIRILKMNKTGQSYLNIIKKDIQDPIITSLYALDHPSLTIERKGTFLLSLISQSPQSIIEQEYKNIPIE